MAPYAEIDSIWIKGVPHEKLITQFNIKRDSLEICVNDPAPQPDTLYLNVDYMKTDTLGNLVPFENSHPKDSLYKLMTTTPGEALLGGQTLHDKTGSKVS